jgi:hypothetical protein
MKLPSIIKIPHYQKFNYEPRYYDPIKEEIEERRSKIRRRLAVDKKAGTRTRMEGAFTRKVPHEEKSGFIRLFVGVILFSGIVGFLYFGNIAIYVTMAVVLGYLLLKKVIFR